MPKSHNHDTPGEGEETPDVPPEVGEFDIPELKFIDIIEERIFPSLPSDLPGENPIFVWSGPNVQWLPVWVNSSIGSLVSMVRSFSLTEELNTLAFWVRNLSRLVMSIIFCIASLKFLNK